MAFFGKIGAILRQASNKPVNSDFSVSKSVLSQAIRCMTTKIFIGGIPYSMDEQSLRETFGKYGDIEDARIIQDRMTGNSRGFGFITYTSTDAASSAIQALDGQDLQGRRVRVNFATERTRTYGDGGGYNNNYGGGGGGGYNTNYGGGGGGYNNYGGSGGGGYNNNYGRNDYASGGDSGNYNTYGSGSGNYSSNFGGNDSATGGNFGSGNNYGSGGDSFSGGGGNYGSSGGNGAVSGGENFNNFEGNNPSTYGDADTFGSGSNAGYPSNQVSNEAVGTLNFSNSELDSISNESGSSMADGEVGVDQVGPFEGNFEDKSEPSDDNFAKHA